MGIRIYIEYFVPGLRIYYFIEDYTHFIPFAYESVLLQNQNRNKNESRRQENSVDFGEIRKIFSVN